MKKIFLVIITLAIASTAAWSQSMIYSRVDQDAISAGMAGSSMASNPSYSWTASGNAAMMSFSENRGDASFSYQSWAPSSFNYLNLGAYTKIGSKLALSAGASYGGGAAFDKTDEYGVIKGSFKPSSLMTGVGASFNATKILSVGLNVSFLSQTVAESYSYGAVSVGLSVAAQLSDFKVSTSIKSLGSSVKSVTGEKSNQALSFGAGALYDKEIGAKSLVKAVLEGDFYTEGDYGVNVGGSYIYNDMVSVRAGYHLGGEKVLPSYASVGAGFKFAGAHIDFAYLLGTAETSPAGSFIIGLGYSF